MEGVSECEDVWVGVWGKEGMCGQVFTFTFLTLFLTHFSPTLLPHT